MAKTFRTSNGKVTDIFHSHEYAKTKYRKRRSNAFDKGYLGQLSERDKLLMRGYAQAKVEDVKAFRYKHPNYVRKTSR